MGINIVTVKVAVF